MWTTQHAIETAATPDAIWEICADVPQWGEGNPDVLAALVERTQRA
jgi:hypothetical protein